MEHFPVGRFARVNIELAEQFVETNAGAGVADPDADRAIFVVDRKRNDCAIEARVAHARHGEKEFPRQEARLGHASRMFGCITRCKP